MTKEIMGNDHVPFSEVHKIASSQIDNSIRPLRQTAAP